MNKRIILSSLIGVFLVASLGGCATEENIKVTDLKSAVRYICNRKNYTLSYSGEGAYAHDFIYTSDSIGVVSEDYIEITDVHIKCNKGVYRLRYTPYDYLPGEILSKGTSLWGNDNYRKTMYRVSTSFLSDVDSKATSIEVKDKKFKLAYAYSIGYQDNEIANIDSLNLTYQEVNNKPQLTFNLIYSGASIKYVAHDFGTSKNYRVEEFKNEGGTYLTLDDELKDMRTLIRANNFCQEVFMFNEDQSGYIGTAVFNPHYYCTIYNGADYLTGYIQIDNDTKKLHGCYYFMCQNNQFNISSVPSYTKPDMVEFFHYPTYLALLDNLEYLEDWKNQDVGGMSPSGTGYYLGRKSTAHIRLLEDFSNNFSMSSNFPGQIPSALGIDYATIEGQLVITFYYKFAYQGGEYVMPFPLYNFGKANISIVDNAYEYYNY